jgi:hypothetical protein
LEFQGKDNGTSFEFHYLNQMKVNSNKEYYKEEQNLNLIGMKLKYIQKVICQ